MSYVDAFRDSDSDEIMVVERVNGQRRYQNYPSKYVFYYEDTKGKYRSIFNDRCSKYQTHSNKSFQKEIKLCSGKKIFESDLNVIFRCLADNYLGKDSPKLHTAFFDIEVDFDPTRGYAPVSDPFAPITAISVALTWLDEIITLVLPPATIRDTSDPTGKTLRPLSFEEAEKICSQFPNTYCFKTEKELLETFLTVIEDSDVLSGWNSTGFDIPYIIGRMELVLSKDHTRKFCLWNLLPKKRLYQKHGRENITYDIFGRIHLDYLELYQKHAGKELHSYRLDYVGQVEVEEKKTVYEGTLDDLYKKDFFTFIEYNRQDVNLLVKIDNKLKYIDLANDLAHTNGVLIPTTMGSVALIDQAIINEAHSLGYVMPDRKRRDDAEEIDEESTAVGAYVAVPKVGLHEKVGGVDINSLYPSTIRTWNMGPETLVGQIRQHLTEEMIKAKLEQGIKTSDIWTDVFACLEYDEVINQTSTPLTLDLVDGQSLSVEAKDIYELIFNSGNPYCITANGTIFRYDIQGIVPHLLSRWYKERKEMQAKAKELDVISDKETDPVKKAELKKEVEFWDRRQLIRKILLNSLYGAILNPYSRVYDERIGQSVTLTGRCITKHMGSKINELITGEYVHDGKAVIYGDTDSIYFSAIPVLKEQPEFEELRNNKEAFITLYDSLADEVNASFAGFLKKSFNVPEKNCVIKAGRELVAERGLFITKKRYAVLIYDKEGKRLDTDGKPGKIKAMGLDLKRSDTPATIQDFLEKTLTKVLSGESQDVIIEYIKDFREEFKKWPAWEKGSPKKVNALSIYRDKVVNSSNMDQHMQLTKQLANAKNTKEVLRIKKEIDKNKKVNLPGHVAAALNWNKLRQMNNDTSSMPIQDGQKVVVCKLKSNVWQMNSIAYPVDEMHLPEWFRTLPFDEELMEDTVFDAKLKNLLEVLNWDLTKTKTNIGDDLFSFG